MNRNELVKNLELIKPALATNNTIPIFQCFMFTEETVSGYNGEIAISGPCEVASECGIHGSTLLGLLSNSTAPEFELELAGSTATIKTGRTTSKLPFEPRESFIFETPDQDYKSVLAITGSFIEGLKLARETVSNDTTQVALLGITIQDDEMYSCDGDTVTRVRLKVGIGRHRILLSTAFCEAVLRLWSELDMVKGKLHFNDKMVMADFTEWQVFGTILGIPNPIDFDAEIKKTIKGWKGNLQAIPEGLDAALSRARVLSDPESQKTTVTVAKGRLGLLTETHMGEIRDDLPLKGHVDIKVNINAAHLQRALKVCNQIAFLENCAVLEAENVLLIVSNMS